jgi:hypothetical protein
MSYEATATLALMAAVLSYIYWRGRQAIRNKRGAMFDGCLRLFESHRLSQDGVYFPVLKGRYQGYEVQIEPVVDHLAVRKLPSLWLLVTVRGRVRYTGVLDFLVRPLNVEFFSPSAALETRLTIPLGWPQNAWLRTDRPEGMPPIERIEPHIRFFDDPRAKELAVTPKGVRLVYLAKEGERAYYTVLRQVEFADPSIPPQLLRDLMDRAIALYEDVK